MVDQKNIRKRWIRAAVAFAIVVVAGTIVRYQDSRKSTRPQTSDQVIRIPAANPATVPAAPAAVPASAAPGRAVIAPQTKRTHADASQLTEDQIARAIEHSKARVAGLSVRIAGDIVVLKGSGAAEDAQTATTAVTSLGVRRVANLITPVPAVDDNAIRRNAERQLATSGALEGSRVHVSCSNGVVRLSGVVRSELQKDAAAAIVRRVPGATNVQLDLKTM